MYQEFGLKRDKPEPTERQKMAKAAKLRNRIKNLRQFNFIALLIWLGCLVVGWRTGQGAAAVLIFGLWFIQHWTLLTYVPLLEARVKDLEQDLSRIYNNHKQ